MTDYLSWFYSDFLPISFCFFNGKFRHVGIPYILRLPSIFIGDWRIKFNQNTVRSVDWFPRRWIASLPFGMPGLSVNYFSPGCS